MTQLIRTIEDLKKHIAIDFIDGFDVIEFAVEDREEELRSKYLGDELYANLVKCYDGTYEAAAEITQEMVNKHNKALWYCQRIISNAAFKDYIPEGELDISENGIRITVTDNKKQAFQWQIEKLEKKYESASDSNLELLLKLLNENLPLFDDWTSSPAYVANKVNFVYSANQFNLFSKTKITHTQFIELQPVISYVEDFYINSALGDDFYDELKERIKDGEDRDEPPADPATSQADEYDKVFKLINGAVVNYVASETGEKAGFDPDDGDKKAAHYMQRLVEYLNNKASADLFAKYYESDKYTAPVDEDTPYAAGEGIDNSAFDGVYGAF